MKLIVNPIAGQSSPDLRLFNRVFHEGGYDWDISITNRFGDGARLTKEAVHQGASKVVVFGGDGTVMDCASGLKNSGVPLAIIPGGTGNVLARDLGIPFDMLSACILAADPHSGVRTIDLGEVNGQVFVLRLGAGLEAEITRMADRDLKDRIGMLAYITATIQVLGQAAVSHYEIEMDGKYFELDGLACMIANAGSLGLPGLTFSPVVRIDDGLFDVIVIRKADLGELASLAANFMGTSAFNVQTIPRWQCREIRLWAHPPQAIQADGEELGLTPIRAKVCPGALKVIAPGPGGVIH